MKNYILLIFFIFFISCSKENLIDVDFSINKQFYSNENINLKLIIKNISDKIIKVPGIIQPQDYSIFLELINLETQRAVKYTGLEYKIKYIHPYNLKPSEMIVKNFNLYDYFPLKVGKFKLIIKFKLILKYNSNSSFGYENLFKYHKKYIFNFEIKKILPIELKKIKIRKNSKCLKRNKKDIDSCISNVNLFYKLYKDNCKDTLIKLIKNKLLEYTTLVLRDGVEINFIDQNNKTALDYLLIEDNKLFRLVRNYGGRLSCEIIDVDCPKLNNSFIGRNFIHGIYENRIDFVKHWIKVNKNNLTLTDIIPDVFNIIDIAKRKKVKTLSKLEFIKLFDNYKYLFNVVKNNETLLDKLIKYYDNKDKVYINVLKYLIQHGAKRSCEILKTKCKPLSPEIEKILKGDK